MSSSNNILQHDFAGKEDKLGVETNALAKDGGASAKLAPVATTPRVQEFAITAQGKRMVFPCGNLFNVFTNQSGNLLKNSIVRGIQAVYCMVIA